VFYQKAKGRRVVVPLFFYLFLLILGMSGCTTLPPPTAQPTSQIEDIVQLPNLLFNAADEALPALIQAERQASIEGNLPMLELLWAADARIVDGRNTAMPDDDYIWQGRTAILDRYIVAVFPQPPPPLTEPLDLVFEYGDTRATAQNAVDHWRFVYQEGRWWLAELVYSAGE